jgi:acyl-CoA synthetase (AMP-forming)/AMP-acid ligase II
MLSTLVDVLRFQAQQRPDQWSYSFLTAGNSDEVRLTYGELDQRARAIASILQQHAAFGERALLLHPPGLEFISAFFGCLYAGAIAVPLYPPHPAPLHRSHSRIHAIAANARASFALSNAATHASVPEGFLQSHDFTAVRWLGTDAIDLAHGDDWHAPTIDGATLAFLQYTSGSTSTPRGVMVSHANLLSNLAALDHSLRHDPHSRFVSWLPHFHDMGLIYGILEPLYKGVPCVLLPPASFVQQPLRWLQALSRYGATHSAAPNFVFDLCARKLNAAERADLNLRNWEVALNGAEPIRQSTLELFAEVFADSGLRSRALCPGYGLAEATLAVSITDKDTVPQTCTVQAAALERHQVVQAEPGQPQTRTLVSSGRIIPDATVVIVDPDRQIPCAGDHVGEIWIAGPSVAQGYWDRPDETMATFEARLTDSGRGPFLRSGDLGFLRDGELFVTGRLKDLIIIDGRNYYPQDIEQTVEHSHPAIRANCCAAFAVDGADGERLVVIAEVERRYRPAQAAASLSDFYQPLDPKAVIKAIRRAVAEEHELLVSEVMLLKIGSVAKTSSGKVQRRACCATYLNGTLNRWG